MRVRRPRFAQRVLMGKDIKVRVTTGLDRRLTRAIYLEHVPFHHGLKKQRRCRLCGRKAAR
jgi:hypothetical protein